MVKGHGDHVFAVSEKGILHGLNITSLAVQRLGPLLKVCYYNSIIFKRMSKLKINVIHVGIFENSSLRIKLEKYDISNIKGLLPS